MSKYSDHRIRFYRNEKGYGAYNLVNNWNKCLEYATGDYVICMGDDDMLEPQCLSYYDVAISEHPDIDVFHGRTTIINDKGDIITKLSARDEVETVWENIWYRWNKRLQYIGDYLFKRDALVKAGGFYFFPLAWGSDDITVNIMIGDKGIVNINSYCFCYRNNCGTISNTSSPVIKMDAIAQEEEWYRDLCNKKNASDDAFYCLVVNKLKDHFLHRRLTMLKYDFTVNRCRLFYWLRNYNKYGLSFKMVVYCWIMGLIGRKANSYKN